ncbi:MAG: hypothetical protein IKO72_01270 [Kiritimatiellae bacterium]|nr:hypothetical protein [Kiritimatiellia bacterium]
MMRLATALALVATAISAAEAPRSEWLPGKYSAWAESKTYSLVLREDGVTEFRHKGKGGWAVNGFNRIAVKPGEAFTFSCRSEQVTDGAASQPFRIGVVLYDAKGEVMSWGWGRKEVQPGDSGSTTFLVPNGVASLMPRFWGDGNFAGSFPMARFTRAEGVENLTREAGLAPMLRISSGPLTVSFDTSNGVFSVADSRTGRTWASPVAAQTASRTIVIQSAIRRTMFATRFVDAESLLRYTVVCRLADDAPEFEVMLSADPGSRLGADLLAFPPPFASKAGDRVVIPYSEGIGVAVDDRNRWLGRYAAFSGGGLCMPFFGIAEDSTGAGWMAILETPDDAYALCSRVGADSLWTISPGWCGQKGCFGYTRRIRYVFQDRGGHVAMARRYREYAAEKGLVKTFREKMKERPLVERLPGAANVWYFPRKGDPDHAAMAKELKDAGIDRFLWSAGPSERAVRAIAALDNVLVGRYDVYQDVYHPEQLKKLGWTSGSNMEAWPADIVWNSTKPGDWRRAWHVKAKDGTTTWCAMMCDMVAPAYARRKIAADLSRNPFTARFIDTTVAAPWQECFNPAHPMTRSESRYWKMELLRIVGDDFRLVTGSEQGHDACVPCCDYLEGMLSLSAWRMPHGGRYENFDQPETPTNVPPARLEIVAKNELGPDIRLPLWELVYHDCCAAHWYWYDYSNWPLSLWKKRDLFNALYGTVGMLVFDGALWKRERARFIASYGTWAPIARRTGFSQMTDHRILSKDRLVQQTAFADGTTVTVNFGEKPFTLPDGSVLAPFSVDSRKGSGR